MNAKAKQPKQGKAERSLLDEMSGVAEAAQNVASDDALATIAALAQQQYEAMLEVARAEDKLKEAKKVLMRISTEDLPTALEAAGIKEFTTKDGLKVTVKEDVTCGITEANRELAYQWLIDHDFAGIIKSEISVSFGKEELEAAEELADEIREKGYDVDFSQNIHAQTLKAFVKERMADTEVKPEDAIPLDLFGARPYSVATVKPRK